MKAISVRSFGPPEVLHLEEVSTPRPSPGEVLVRVRAAGVCYHDVLNRAGRLPDVKPPIVLGHEIAGEIAEVGAYVTGVGVGDRVCVFPKVICGVCSPCRQGHQNACRRGRLLGTHRDGGYAEYVCVPAFNAVRIPAVLSFETAALLTCAVGTSYRALRTLAGLGMGESLLVTGAGGGLGRAAIQLAKLTGARVIAVTTSAAKVEVIRASGADEVIIAPDLQFSRKVWELTGGLGVDVALDLVVTETFAEALRCLCQCGRYVLVGNIAPADLPLSPGLIIRRHLKLMGTSSVSLNELHEVIDLAAAGTIRAQAGFTAPLAEAAAIHHELESRRTVGRVVLV